MHHMWNIPTNSNNNHILQTTETTILCPGRTDPHEPNIHSMGSKMEALQMAHNHNAAPMKDQPPVANMENQEEQ